MQHSFSNGILNNAKAPPGNLIKLRNALNRVRNGTGRATILCLGESTTAGVWANDLSTGDWWSFSPPKYMVDRFNARGINAHRNSFMGNGGSLGTTINNDARVITNGGGSFATYGGVNTLGGRSLTATDATAGSFNWQPTVNVDTFKVYYVTTATTSNFNVSINGGSATAINANTGILAPTSMTITASLGSNTLNIGWTAGTAFIIGVEAWDSSKSWVSVINAGNSGAASAILSATNTAYAAANMIPIISPDLTIINEAINDWIGSVSLSTFETNIQTLITKGLITGDVLVVAPVPTQPSSPLNIPLATQEAYINVLRKLASKNNVAYLDIWHNWQPINNALYSQASSSQLIHPNFTGYDDNALQIMNLIANI